MAGMPTATGSPGRVTVPTPVPPRRMMSVPALRRTLALITARWVTSGSSPPSLTTAARMPSPSFRLSRIEMVMRSPMGSSTSTLSGARPVSRCSVAALAAAAAAVPVVKP